MWDNILTAALNNGLWAALFVALMVYVLRDTAKREKKYTDIIEQLSDKLSIVKEIQTATKDAAKELADIKAKISKKGDQNNV